ncbi:metalloregulator ArsR/SmtB family transcription factor [Anaerocolumna xylanovorans]|uniref:HTH arsR-type domain-containing protein n=1 Tax=Anaerocolumna xylanovorans DSM 12503 TaxID=1121345 RepID=A0A1M7Y1A4_9FIRM|nr:metalloregulator ArsR/SmtB family transcription factor [Anaerocolumna xylanovorans]SHO45487.1 hypothetical protein SAMN02745217_00972 [Anaerocolumna xylanovorans DSM 12503]
MTEADALKLFKVLADKSRMRILKSLIIEDMYVERLAERLALTPATISFHLKKLEDAGAVTSYKDQYYMMYSLCKDIFMTNILEIIKEEADNAEEQEERDRNYRKRVIDSFFEYGKLKSIPAQRKKERIILEEIAKSFEKGKEYSEKDINIIIADFHDDFCTIRRDMISEGILERNGNIYKAI